MDSCTIASKNTYQTVQVRIKHTFSIVVIQHNRHHFQISFTEPILSK